MSAGSAYLAFTHRKFVARVKRRKPHPETHFSLYPCGYGVFPRSKMGKFQQVICRLRDGVEFDIIRADIFLEVFKMRIAHLCYYYGNNTSGAPIAATRLHQALLRAGVESHFICVNQRDSGVNVHVLPKSPLVNWLFYLVVRVFWVASKIVTGKMLMPNVLPLVGLKKTINDIDPDVIHIQYIGQDMLSFSQLAALPQPKVFTLHDISIVNALDPYPGSDKRFLDDLNSKNSTWIERLMFRRKQAFVSKANVVFTGPSRWICDLFNRSIIGKNRRVYEVPNIVDPIYSFDGTLRARHEKFIILFGAYGGRSSRYKGWSDLEASLRLLPQEIRANTKVCIFGEDAEPGSIDGIELQFLGAIQEPGRLRAIHHTADVFAMPSRQDNAPQVKFEALMSGLPVLAFQRTGCAEYIESRQNGWIAPDGDLQNYADGLAYFYHLFKSGKLESMRPGIAKNASSMFSEKVIIDKMIEVYQACCVPPLASTCGPVSRQ